MKDYGFVSVIMASYNSALFIKDSIESIIGQTYTNWELLITDDSSSDNTVEIVKSYQRQDKRIKLFVLDKNSGAAVARNQSIKEAKGRFLAFCDSDDKWLPQKLEKHLEFMSQKQCALSFTSYLTCNEDLEIDGIIVCKEKVHLKMMIADDKIGCLTAIYDTEKVGGKVYMPLLRKRQDWGLWLLILQKIEWAYGYKEPLSIYTKRKSGSLSSNKLTLVKYTIRIYRDILGYNSFRAWSIFILRFLPTYFIKRILNRKNINRIKDTFYTL